MKWHTLVAIEDINVGDVGLILKKMDLTKIPDGEVYGIFQGFTLAHDLLEHVNGIQSIGSIDDELEALGAMWYTRGQFGSLGGNDYHSPIDSIAIEIVTLARLYVIEGIDFINPPKKTKAHLHDENFKEILTKSKKEILYYENELNIKRLEFFYSVAIHYLRDGFNKAHKRFKNPHTAYALFMNIKQVFDTAIKHIELYPDMEFRIGYTLEGHVIFKDTYGEIYYEQK